MRAALGLILLVFYPAHGQDAAGPSATGSIHGIVLDARTKAPLPDVRIQMSGPPLPTPDSANAGIRLSAPGVARSTPTDSEGQFLFWDLPPGFYRITASTASGSWRLAYKSVNLADGQNAEIELRAEAPGTISGRVIDQDGKPVSGMTVSMLCSEYFSGILDYRLENKTATEDDGTFILTDAAPGIAHAVRVESAVPSLLQPVSEEPESPADRKPVAEAAWYPGAANGALAQSIVLYSGEQRKDIEIRVRRLPGRCVEGVLEDVHGPASMQFESPVGRSVTGEDGRFRLCGVPRGEFRITAQLRGDPPPWGAVTIPAGDRDVSGLKLIAAPMTTATLRGVVDLEGGPSSGKLSGSLVIMVATRTAANVMAMGTFYGGMVTSSIPGTFSIPNLIPGNDYDVRATGAPGGYEIRGLPNRGEPFHFGGGGTQLKLIVGRWRGGTFGATATDAEGKPVFDASILAFPAAADSEAALSAGMIVCSPDQSGGCQLQLDPGKYLVVATAPPISNPNNRETIARIWRARSKAKAIEITAGSAVQVTLTVTELD